MSRKGLIRNAPKKHMVTPEELQQSTTQVGDLLTGCSTLHKIGGDENLARVKGSSERKPCQDDAKYMEDVQTKTRLFA